MKHFEPLEWLLFYQGEAGEEKEAVMEKHLTVCEDCMYIFLECIDETKINRTAAIIPPDFTAQTLKLVQEQDKRRNYGHVYQHMTRCRRKLFSYYVAAAAVTLMLMNGGFFQSVIRPIPDINMPYSLEAEKQDNFIFTWPTQLREKTTGWIGSIELKNHKEVK